MTAESPQKETHVRDVVLAAPRLNPPHVNRVCQTIKRRVYALKRAPIAQINRPQIFRSEVFHVLRRRKQLKKLDDVCIPARRIARELFEHGGRTLASPVGERVRDLCAVAETSIGPSEECARADQIADVRHSPLGAGLDELIVVELRQVFFQHADLFGDDREQRLERFASFRVARAIDGRQQRVEFLYVEAHASTSSLSGLGSSVSSSAAKTLSVPASGAAAGRRGCKGCTKRNG